MSFRKSSSDSAPRAAEVESAGLRWLSQARAVGGAAVVEVLDVEEGLLTLEEVSTGVPSREAAEAFGTALAHTHRSLPAGTPFGALAPDHPPGVPPVFGPADQLLVMGSGTHSTWGAFHAEQRLDPLLALVADAGATDLGEAERHLLFGARERIASGAFDDQESPSLIHGDLWSGNVLWRGATGGGGGDGATREGVLIDPAAHAGHRESDLAMMLLFGMPHLQEMLHAYEWAAPLRDGWRARVPVHQLFYLLGHWVLFGPAYANATLRACDEILAR